MHWPARTVLLAMAVLSSGCSLFYPTTIPIPTVEHHTGGPHARVLMVMLPGRGGSPEDYVKEGFIDMLAAAGLSVDAVAVDAHFGYYYSRTLLPRLAEDVIGPARAEGYEKIWILGVSMGGLGALLYAQKHSDSIDGLILLAPFLGDDDVIDELVASGGLASWTPPADLDEGDYQRGLWKWLKRYADDRQALPSIQLGWGTEDGFARSCELLAAVLPAERIHRFPGGHEWVPWRKAFAAVLSAGIFPRAKP